MIHRKKQTKKKSSIKTTSKKPKPTNKRYLDIWNPAIIKRITNLIEEINPKDDPFSNEDIIREIIVTAFKAGQSHISRLDFKILSRSIRELRYAFKIFRSYRGIPKVTIFGSARTKPTEKAYQIAHAFAKKITDRGYMVITGAGPGIMQAGNHGAPPAKSFGVNIRLPFEQEPNKYIANQLTYIDCRYFFTRKLVFVKETNAVVVFSGGYGTMDEAFEILTLIQTGKAEPIPVVFVDAPGGTIWKDMDKFIRKNLLKTKRISKEDLSLYKIVSSADAAINEITRFYSNYHSLRFVKDKLVMRFKHAITDKQLKYVNANFIDLLHSGTFKKGKALKVEANQPDILHLPRLIGKFNRINNGRLRQLIDFMNK